MALSNQFRTALVTGASSGLGAAFVEMLLREGLEVWGTSRDVTRVPDRGRFHGLALALSDRTSTDRVWAQAEQVSGGIDLLINNAGAGRLGPFVDTSADDWTKELEVLLHGPARLARHAWSSMAGRGRGCIVNVTSLAVEFPIPHMSAYNAAKSGLSALSASLDLEGSAGKVRVLDFRPGDYRTTFNQAMRSNSDPSQFRSSGRVWERLEKLMQGAPPPERAARDLCRALARRRRGVVRSGSYFQAAVAPFLQRFAPLRLSAAVQRRYFDCD